MRQAQKLQQLFADLGPTFVDLFMPDTCTIERLTVVRDPDSTSGRSEEWRALTTVPCQVYRSGSSDATTEQLVASRQASVVAYRVSLPLGTDVTSKDELVLSDGRRLAIRTVPQVSIAATLQLVCVEAS